MKNVAEILDQIKQQRKKRGDGFLLFIDLRKDYDSVNRDKVIQILQKRCRNDRERAIVDRIDCTTPSDTEHPNRRSNHQSKKRIGPRECFKPSPVQYLPRRSFKILKNAIVITQAR
jgi:hypothetical protein